MESFASTIASGLGDQYIGATTHRRDLLWACLVGNLLWACLVGNLQGAPRNVWQSLNKFDCPHILTEQFFGEPREPSPGGPHLTYLRAFKLLGYILTEQLCLNTTASMYGNLSSGRSSPLYILIGVAPPPPPYILIGYQYWVRE
jgi:hypothetical protein